MAKKTKRRRNINGNWEVVDAKTGEVLSESYAVRNQASIEKGQAIRHRFNRKELLELFTADGEKVYCPKEAITTVLDYKEREVKIVWGTNADSLPKRVFPYNDTTAKQICSRIMDGMTVLDIVKEKGMPDRATFYYWMAKNEEFKEMVDRARRIRAESLHDEIIGMIRDDSKMEDKVDIERVKTKMAGLKWAAEKGDPEKYGNKSSGTTGPAQIIINTGINREDDTTTVEVEGKKIG